MSGRAGHVTTETVYGQTLVLPLGNRDEHHALESGTTGLNVEGNLDLGLGHMSEESSKSRLQVSTQVTTHQALFLQPPDLTVLTTSEIGQPAHLFPATLSFLFLLLVYLKKKITNNKNKTKKQTRQ